MKKFVAILGVVALGFVLSLTGCNREKNIKIGVIVPLTGQLASIGKDVKFSIQLAAKHVNATGGVRNKPIKLFFEDSHGMPEQGKRAFMTLKKRDGVKLIIGGVASEVTLALAPLAKQSEIPIVSPTSSSPRITTKGNDYVFRVYPSDTIEARRLADTMFTQLFIRNFVPIAIKNEYGYGISNELLKIARGTPDMKVPEVIRYSPDATPEDFVAIAEKVKALNPEAVLIAGYPEDGANILKALYDAKVTCYKFATSSMATPGNIQAIGDPAVGLIHAKALFNPKATDEKTRRFVKEFVDMSGKEPDVYAAHAYDALYVAAHAFSKSSRPDDILRRLQQTKGFKGVAGDITFDRYGDVVKFPKIFRVRKDENGVIRSTLLTDEDIKQIKDKILKIGI